jgi:[ribosomal protein S5]-alanine N-acetyltransferase
VACAQEVKQCSRDEALSWIARHAAPQRGGAGISFAIADAECDDALGYVGLLHRPTAGLAPVPVEDGLVYKPDVRMAGIGYVVIERARRRGLASTAVSLVAEWALSEAGLARVEAFVEPSNLASQRVLENAGFVREGLLSAYLAVPDGRADAFVYGRTAG